MIIMKKSTSSAATEEKFWDSETVVSMTPTPTGKSATRVAVVEKDGQAYVDIRTFVNKKGEKEGFAQHTTKGISIPVDNINAITAAIQKAGAKAKGVVK